MVYNVYNLAFMSLFMILFSIPVCVHSCSCLCSCSCSCSLKLHTSNKMSLSSLRRRTLRLFYNSDYAMYEILSAQIKNNATNIQVSIRCVNNVMGMRLMVTVIY